MDFFKSVFSEDPEEPSSLNPENTPPSSPKSPHNPNPNPNPNPNSANLPAISTAWTFGSTLFKTLATKSESLVENYRRDLEEFSTGLKKETATIRQVASRAVQDLPSRLESGAAVAQTSLESVGQAIDNITDVIVTRGKDSISVLTSDDYSSDSELSENRRSDFYEKNVNFDVNNSNNKPYSRIEAAIRAIQCDLKTYIEDPEDVEDYNEWRKGFFLDEKSEGIEGLVEENPVVKEIYDEVVPGGVDRELFWSRYFYRVYRVKKVEEARMRLVERAISGEVEEELSWDVDDDDEEAEGSREGFKTRDELKKEIEESGKKMEGLRVGGEEKSVEKERDEKESVSETKSEDGVEEKGRSDEAESSGDKSGMKMDEKASSDGRNDNSDFSVVSSQPSHEEEDIGWDEFEDIRSGDESKAAARVSPSRADLRKRLSAAEEEDLGWDTEDDDEPIKS